jgi:hypothetical protein
MIRLEDVDNYLFFNKADKAFIVKALKCGAKIVFIQNAFYFDNSQIPICFVRKINY